MSNYYASLLNASRLQKCYEVAPTRVKQFLDAEIDFVLAKVNSNDTVLDLGCGYGRVSTRLLEKAKSVVGVDISKDNIELAKKIAGNTKNCKYFVMDAIELSFDDGAFDIVICIQNGISAFKVDPHKLLKEAIRVTHKGGTILFSSYSPKFWNDRLEWFRIQADHGLVGEIDETLTKDGVIVCKDGFRAITFSGHEFLELASKLSVQAQIHEVDNSSIFCEMVVK